MNTLLRDKTREIEMILLDVDGVLTDGSIIIGNDGFEAKRFNVQDGLGISMAQEVGLDVAIITGRISEAVRTRADELDIDEVYQGQIHKKEALIEINQKRDLESEELLFMGDDLLDLEVIKQVGVSIVPENGRKELKNESDYVTSRKGGKGAVREAIEWLLKQRGEFNSIVNSFVDQ